MHRECKMTCMKVDDVCEGRAEIFKIALQDIYWIGRWVWLSCIVYMVVEGVWLFTLHFPTCICPWPLPNMSSLTTLSSGESPVHILWLHTYFVVPPDRYWPTTHSKLACLSIEFRATVHILPKLQWILYNVVMYIVSCHTPPPCTVNRYP